MPVIEINAIDTFFFRNGKPFEKGEDNWAEGRFPPSPSVIYGALRTAYFTAHPSEITKANTDEDPTLKLSIKGVWIKRGNDLLCSAPLDFIVDKDGEDKQMKSVKLVQREAKKYAGNSGGVYPYDFIPYYEGNGEGVDSLMLDCSSILEYNLNGNYFGTSSDELRTSEAKIGVGLDNFTRSNKEGNLYRVGLSRLTEKFDAHELEFKNRVSLVIDYDFDFIPDLIKLGAEGKTAYCSLYSKRLKGSKSAIDWDGKSFRLILLTPGILEKGSFLDLNAILTKSDFSVRTICAFVGKIEAIGGWEMKGGKTQKGQPKPMRRALPAGTVFYFSIESNHTYKDLIAFLVKENIYSICQKEEDTKKGFGLFATTPLFINDQIIAL